MEMGQWPTESAHVRLNLGPPIALPDHDHHEYIFAAQVSSHL